ncbi:MAG: stage sporulation protein, partial [Pseudomonadota bacterium]
MSGRGTPPTDVSFGGDDPPSRLTPAPEVRGGAGWAGADRGRSPRGRGVEDGPVTSLPPVEPLPAPSTVPTASSLALGEVTSVTSPAVRDVRDLLPVFEGVDLPMLTAVVTLVAIGMVMVMTASSHFGIQTEASVWAYGIKQAVGIGLGLFAAVLVMLVPYRWLRWSPVPFYVLTLIVLGLVQSPMGVVVKGARRWLDLGPLRLQPSEIAKLSISLLLARHFNLNRGRADDFWGVLVPVGVWLAPAAGLVILQRDLGQTMLLLGITGVAIVVGGTPLRWITAFLGIVTSFVLLAIALEPYRVTRVLNFLDPLSTADAEGLQVAQGWVAIAVGGPWGVGLGNGVAQQGFLPEAHTDMILAVIGEETGVFGMLAVLVLELVVIARGM